jgi:hypothetical protein
VATSVAIGPDGAYYVSELGGSPRRADVAHLAIEPDARHVHCDPDVSDGPCTMVADGFTSIVDLTFGQMGPRTSPNWTRRAGSRSRWQLTRPKAAR